MEAPFLEMPVQIVFASGHTSGSYITEQGWKQASIQRRPLCQNAIRSHGSYERKFPAGMRIARFYCRPCHATVSLLPDFLAAGYSETLDVQSKAIETVKRCGTFTAAAHEMRPDIQSQGALRWLRRRIRRHQLAALLLATALGTNAASLTPMEIRAAPAELVLKQATSLG